MYRTLKCWVFIVHSLIIRGRTLKSMLYTYLGSEKLRLNGTRIAWPCFFAKIPFSKKESLFVLGNMLHFMTPSGTIHQSSPNQRFPPLLYSYGHWMPMVDIGNSCGIIQWTTVPRKMGIEIELWLVFGMAQFSSCVHAFSMHFPILLRDEHLPPHQLPDFLDAKTLKEWTDTSNQAPTFRPGGFKSKHPEGWSALCIARSGLLPLPAGLRLWQEPDDQFSSRCRLWSSSLWKIRNVGVFPGQIHHDVQPYGGFHGHGDTQQWSTMDGL